MEYIKVLTNFNTFIIFTDFESEKTGKNRLINGEVISLLNDARRH